MLGNDIGCHLPADIETPSDREDKAKRLRRQIEQTPQTSIRLHPNLAELYREKIASLRDALDENQLRDEAAGILRELIDEIRLVPEDGILRIYLASHMAAMLALAQNAKHPGRGTAGVQLTLVAGARNRLYLQLSEAWL